MCIHITSCGWGGSAPNPLRSQERPMGAGQRMELH